MGRFGLVGPTYASRSPVADSERCINYIPERDEGGQAKSGFQLNIRPGLKKFATLGEGPGRGSCEYKGRFFSVGGGSLYEVYADGTTNQLYQLLANDGLPASFAGNQANQIVLSSGGTVYLLDMVANQVTQPSGLLGKVGMVGYADGYFVALLADSGKFQISALLDGNTWPGLQVNQTSVFPDNITTMIIDHRELIVGGPKASIGHYDSGSLNIYDVLPGAYMEIGAAATWGRTKLDNTVFWWGQNEHGAMMAFRAEGYQPARVSNHSVEYMVQGYSDWRDVECFAFQEFGHTLWVSRFPSANNGRGATHVLDVSTGLWHEWDWTDPKTGLKYAHLARNHAFAFRKHLVQDWRSGAIYEMSSAFLDDDGAPVIKDRIGPPVSREDDWIFHDELRVSGDPAPGLGLLTGLSEAQAQIVLPDPSGNLWAVTANDNGTLNYAAWHGSPQTPLILNDYQQANTLWQVIIAFDQAGEPVLATTQVTY